MKSWIFTLLFAPGILSDLAAQCQVITLPYGQVQMDISRGYKIIPTQDGNFVIAGEWNDEAFLLKVNPQGQQLALKKYGGDVTGQSSFQDVVEASDGGFVAVGECNNCVVPNDSLTKVIAIKTDANLNLDASIGVKKFGKVTLPGGFVTANRQTNPRIVRTGDDYLLATCLTLGASINWEDVGVTKLSESLVSAWVKSYNTGYFEAPFGIAATADGFIMPVNRAFLSEASLLKINGNGDILWIKVYEADFVRGITYLPNADDVVVIGQRMTDDQALQAFLMRFDAATGMAQDSLLFGENLGDYGYDVQTLANGDLLAAIVTDRPNPFGIYATSRIYRINADTLSVNCFYLIPNPDNITNMSVRSIVPLSENGKDFAAAGIRGFYNRAFFHTRRDCEVTYSSAAICPGESYMLPDGTVVNAPGIYNTTIPAVNGCDSVIQTTVQQYAPIPLTEISVTLCSGENYILPNDQSVNTAGVYDVVLTASNGCDSIVRTTLAYFDPIPIVEVDVALCPGKTHTLPNGQIVSIPGVYTVTLVGPNGCNFDVVTTVEGLIAPIVVVDVDLCPGETYALPNGQIVSAAGTYDVVYSVPNGCDSTVRTVIELLDAPILWVDVFLCAGTYYTLPNGDTVSTGSYDFPYTGPNGCEGVMKIGVITFPPIEEGDVVIQTDNGQGSGSIILNNVSGGGGGFYQFHWSNGATTAAIDSLSFGSYTVTITDAWGCSEVFSYAVGLVNANTPLSGLDFHIAPNPFSDQIRCALELDDPVDCLFDIRLYDAWGKCHLILPTAIGKTQTLNTSDLPAGVYFVQLLKDKKPIFNQRLVKQ